MLWRELVPIAAWSHPFKMFSPHTSVKCVKELGGVAADAYVVCACVSGVTYKIFRITCGKDGSIYVQLKVAHSLVKCYSIRRSDIRRR